MLPCTYYLLLVCVLFNIFYGEYFRIVAHNITVSSIEARLWWASLLRHSGNGVRATALWQWRMAWCWCYNDSICTMELPTIVLAPLASGVNNYGV